MLVNRKLLCARLGLPSDTPEATIRAALGPTEAELLAAYLARFFPETCPTVEEEPELTDEPSLREIEAGARRPGFCF